MSTGLGMGTTSTPQGVKLVDKNYAGCIFLCLVKQISYSGGAHTDKQFNKFRATDRKERHPGLSSDSAGKQGFAGTRRSVEQHALRNSGTKGLEFLGCLQKFLDLMKFLNRFVRSGETPTPGLAGGRIAEEVHESCVDAWEEKFMPERHRRKNRKEA